MDSSPTLVLFDIDGTLVLTGRAGLRAMVATFESLWGVPDAFNGVSMGGRTDSWLVSHALTRWGLPDTPDNHARFRADYVPRLAEEILQPGTGLKGVMPGVRALLDAASASRHVHLALLTGNYREAAEIKLRHFDALAVLRVRRVLGRFRRTATIWCRLRGNVRWRTAFPRQRASEWW